MLALFLIKAMVADFYKHLLCMLYEYYCIYFSYIQWDYLCLTHENPEVQKRLRNVPKVWTQVCQEPKQDYSHKLTVIKTSCVCGRGGIWVCGCVGVFGGGSISVLWELDIFHADEKFKKLIFMSWRLIY